MAMFECPGCKHIVDDSIKKCPNCSYDIKKYVKAMMKDAKKNGKTINESSLALSSVYSSDNSKGGALPTLDFLSKPAAPAPSEKPVLESPSLNAPASSVVFDSPSLNAAAAAKASVAPVSAPASAISKPASEPVPSISAPVSAPVAPAPVEPKTVTQSSFSVPTSAPVLPVSTAAAATAASATAFSGLSKPAAPVAPATSASEPVGISKPAAPVLPVSESVFESPTVNKTSEFISASEEPRDTDAPVFAGVSEAALEGVQKFSSPEAVIPSAIPSTTTFSPIGRAVQNGSPSIHIEAPSIPAPERTPVVSNGSSIPPTPVYNDDALRKSSELTAPIFDSPELNAAQNSNTHLPKPASVASMASISKPAPTYGSYGSSISQPAAPSFGSSVSSAPASAPAAPATSAASSDSASTGGFVFESAALNEQARKIANGEYVPASKASQATLSLLDKDVSQLAASASISHRTFGQAPQQSTYKPLSPELGGAPVQSHSANPFLAGTTGQQAAPSVPQNVYGQNNYSSPVGQSSLYGSGQPVAPSSYNQQASQAPAYGSFGNASIPTNGQSGVGAQNPLLAGNPLLGGGRQ